MKSFFKESRFSLRCFFSVVDAWVIPVILLLLAFIQTYAHALPSPANDQYPHALSLNVPSYLQWYFSSWCRGCNFDRCLRMHTQNGSIMRWVFRRCSTIST